MLTYIAVVACLACGTGELGFATSPVQPAASVASAFAESATGIIMNVDSEKKTFTLNTKSGETEIKINDSTEFTLDGKKSTMAEALKAGREATVSHDNKTASRVDVKSA